MSMNTRHYSSDKGGSGGGGAGSGTPPPAGGTAEPKTYTRAELDAMFADVRRGAGEAATKRLLEAAGVTSEEELNTKLVNAKKLQDQQMSDSDKAKQQATDAEAKLKAEQEKNKTLAATTATKLMRLAVISEAMTQGIDSAELESVWREIRDDGALKGTIKPRGEDSDEFEGVAEAVKQVATRHPKWLAGVGIAGDGVGTSKPLGSRKASREAGATEATKEQVEQKLRATGAYRG